MSKQDRRSEVRSERRVFRVLRVLPSICCLLAAQLSAQSPFDAFPSQEIALADWGLTDVAQIGRVHIGILHQRSGDAIGRAPDATPALIFSYSNTLPSFAGFWIHLFDFKQHPADRVFLDASPFTYLTFSIRGERGGEALLLQMADRAWEEREQAHKANGRRRDLSR